MNDTSLATRDFFKEIKQRYFGLVTDNAWPVIATEVITKHRITSLQDQLIFWKKVRRGFIYRERKYGTHLHKGQIDWRLSQIYLELGDINKAISSLNDAVIEDEQIAPDRHLAAYYFRSIVKPIIYRFNKRTHNFDRNRGSLIYYNSLSQNEGLDLKNILFEVHDYGASGRAKVITDFNFIANPDLRTFVQKTYSEIAQLILMVSTDSYYACVITVGGILEAMLGDLIENSPSVSRRSKLRAKRSGLGTQIGIIRGQHIEILPKQIIILCEVICEYRNLVHFNHAVSNEHDTTRYLASYLLTLLAYIGHYCWPQSPASPPAPSPHP